MHVFRNSKLLLFTYQRTKSENLTVDKAKRLKSKATSLTGRLEQTNDVTFFRFVLRHELQMRSKVFARFCVKPNKKCKQFQFFTSARSLYFDHTSN